MAEDSRDYPRAQLPAVRARYENAAGVTLEAEVLDIGQGGVFIKTDAPINPGKRLALELIVIGEPRPIPVVARVVWVRAIAASEARPEGMGLKFIDLEEDALAQIGALVHTRERTIQGIGFPGLMPTPEIDPELLAGDPPVSGGVFVADARDVSARDRSPGETNARSGRERTLVGIEAEGGILGRTPEGVARRSQASISDARSSSAGRERSIPLGLVTKKPHVETFQTDDRPSSPSDDTQPSRFRASQFQRRPRHQGAKWASVIAVAVLAGGAGYVYRDRLTGFVRAANEPEHASTPIGPPVVSTVDAAASVHADAPENTAIAQDASVAALTPSPAIDAGVVEASTASVIDAGKSDAPAATVAAPKKPAAPRPKPKPRAKPEDDNPY